MNKLKWLLYVVGGIQLILGAFYLFAPEFFLKSVGHSLPREDIYYPLAMLASRFIVFGIVFLYIARQALENRLWIFAMIMIQALDLAAGIFYTFSNVVPIKLSGFPMFNALWIMVLCYLWLPKKQMIETINKAQPVT